MKKMMLAFLAIMMILGSLRAFADDTVQTQAPMQKNEAAVLIVLGTLKALAEQSEQGTNSLLFDTYKHPDTQNTIVLLPRDLVRQFGAIARSSGTDAEKASQIADLVVELVSDTSERSFCAAAARISTAHIADAAEKETSRVGLLEGCRFSVNKHRILKYLEKPYTVEDFKDFEFPENMSRFEKIRLGYSVGVFLLMLKPHDQSK